MCSSLQQYSKMGREVSKQATAGAHTAGAAAGRQRSRHATCRGAPPGVKNRPGMVQGKVGRCGDHRQQLADRVASTESGTRQTKAP